MPTVAAEKADLLQHGVAHWAATDPVEPLHDYTIPVLPFKRPPAKDDFQQVKRRRKQQDSKQDQPRTNPTKSNGHVDDYA